MKKGILFISLLMITAELLAQTSGINTVEPKATLDVVGEPTDATIFDGIIPPRITGDQLGAKTYTAEQTGAMVYVNTAATTPAGQTINVVEAGYYYFDGAIWIKVSVENPITADNGLTKTGDNIELGGTLLKNTEIITDGFNTIFSGTGRIGLGTNDPKSLFHINANGNTTGINTSFVDGLAITSNVNSGGLVGPGFYFEGANATVGQKLMKLNYTTNNVGNTFLNFQAVTDDASASSREIMQVYHSGNIGIGLNANTNPASERLDVGTGNIRIRDINTNVGVGGQDRQVVADANGVLKTLDQGNYTLFHARLAANQNHVGGGGTTFTLLYAAPLATSPIFTYNTGTGTLTFNEPGNYLVTMQASFANTAQGTQMVMGVRPVPDAPYLGRGSSYNAVATGASVGQLMNYTTMIVVPNAGYQVRFVTAANGTYTILATETGGTGSGNVTNVTVQKI
ncbi:hypothetical protein ACFSKL_22240 [Belliella marina]|uniref:C1q domain-containing protein n=1 Tax=Belliella marina TaxID=1644146 RepID=A0ABW4VXB0_9BACT